MKLTSKIDNFQQVCSVFEFVGLKLGGGELIFQNNLIARYLHTDIHPLQVKALTSALDSGEASSTFGQANAIFLFVDPIRNPFLKK